MPVSTIDLISKSGLDVNLVQTVKWNTKPLNSKIGIYFVSTCEDPSVNSNLYDNAPLDNEVLKFWLAKVSTFLLDNKHKPTYQELNLRLSKFWFPDESILYIGQTESGGGLRSRVNQYYKTELGERKPHVGGHWLKTLTILNQLYVHYLPDIEPTKTEEKLLHSFVDQVSIDTKKILYDQNLTIPFANLELERGNRKRHGLSKTKLGDK